jgi:hypothetical protein
METNTTMIEKESMERNRTMETNRTVTQKQSMERNRTMIDCFSIKSDWTTLKRTT